MKTLLETFRPDSSEDKIVPSDHIDVEIEDENRSVSDLMTTEDEDDNDDDEQDDDEDEGRHENVGEADDEPILGFWMESVMSPPESNEKDADGFCKAEGKSNLDGELRNGEDGIKALVEEFIREKDSPSDVNYFSFNDLSILIYP